jgi:hypothetical protein
MSDDWNCGLCRFCVGFARGTYYECRYGPPPIGPEVKAYRNGMGVLYYPPSRWPVIELCEFCFRFEPKGDSVS